MSSDWVTCRISGLGVCHLAFSADKRWLAACSQNECLIWDTSNGRRVATVPVDEPAVGSFFTAEDKIVTVTSTGDIAEWKWTGPESEAQKLRSARATAYDIKGLQYVVSTNCAYVLTEGKFHATALLERIELGGESPALTTIGTVPKTTSSLSWTVADRFYAYIDGKVLHVVSLEDSNEKGSFTYKSLIREFSEEENEQNVFVCVHATKNTVAAALRSGRIYIWQNVMPKLRIEDTQSVHWHHSKVNFCLLPSGGLISIGAENTMVKFASTRAKPSFLRIEGSAKCMHLSSDAALLAVLREDNSVTVVQTGSFTVQTSCCGIYQSRQESKLWVPDHCYTRYHISVCRPGWLQWVESTSGFALEPTHISLENVEMGGYEALANFFDVYAAFLGKHAVCTLERRINWPTETRRIRFWGRSQQPTLLTLQETFGVAPNCAAVTGCPNGIAQEDKIFITVSSDSQIVVYAPIYDGSGNVQWKRDNSRDTEWQNAVFRTCSHIQPGGLWVSAHSAGPNGDCIVFWDTYTMRVLEVITCDAEVSSVDWATSNIFIYSTANSVCAFDIRSLTVAWTVVQSLPVHCSPFGCFVIDGANVMQFEPSTGRVQETVLFPTEIEQVLCRRVKGVQNNWCLVARGKDGSLMIGARRSALNTENVLKKKDEKTPFAALTSAETDRDESSGYKARRISRVVRPADLLAAPAHALPPLTHIAPLFITSCLLPPAETTPMAEEKMEV